MALDKVLSTSIANGAVTAAAISNTANLVVGSISIGNSTVNTVISSSSLNTTSNTLTIGSVFNVVANGNVGFGNNTPNSNFVIQTNASGAIPGVNVLVSGNAPYVRGMTVINDALGANGGMLYGIGKEDSARNMGQLVFHYNSSNSTSNRTSLGLHSVDNLINMFGSGAVSVGSNLTPNSSYKLSVEGNTYTNGVIYSSLPGLLDHEYVRLYDGQLANENLDDLYNDRTGVYYSTTQYSTNSNIPYSNYFNLINIRNPVNGFNVANTADRATQLWLGDTVGRAYLRVRQGTNGWYNWENILTSSVPGTVVQIQYNTNNSTSGSITGTTLTSTGISVSITPKHANNLILIMGHLHVYKSTSTAHFIASIYRNGAAIITGTGVGGSDNDAGTAHYDAPAIVVDIPGTTSNTTYTWYAATRESGGTVLINDNGTYRSGIVAIEITGTHPGRAA